MRTFMPVAKSACINEIKALAAYFSLSYLYFAQEGMKISATPTSATVSITPAPGQCITLNKQPSTVKELNKAPEINASCFITFGI